MSSKGVRLGRARPPQLLRRSDAVGVHPSRQLPYDTGDGGIPLQLEDGAYLDGLSAQHQKFQYLLAGLDPPNAAQRKRGVLLQDGGCGQGHRRMEGPL